MDADGLTVSATECARLTGISRERLRTWERRHGYPVPERIASGRRRYRLADVGTLINIRRAVDGGMPIATAIETAQTEAPGAPGIAALAKALDETPLPTLVIAGPVPATIVYANRAARARAETPAMNSVVGGDLDEQITAAFANGEPTRFDRPSWSEDGVPVTCLAVPIDAGSGPALIALYDVEAGDVQDQRASAAAVQTELERIGRDLEERDAALDLGHEVAQALRQQAGVEAIIDSVELILRRLGAVDVALAPYMTGQIVIGRSARGMLGPDMLTVAAVPDVAWVIREGETRDRDAGGGARVADPGGARRVDRSGDVCRRAACRPARCCSTASRRSAAARCARSRSSGQRSGWH